MSVTVGDDIRFTGESDYFDRSAIYTVTDLVGYGNIIVDNPGCPNGIYYGEYEIITKEVDTMEKAQKGDLIRIIPHEGNGYIGKFYEVGDVFEVFSRDDDDGIIIESGRADGDKKLYVYDEEYVIHRKAGEEDSEQDALAHYQSEVLGEEKAELDAVNSPNHYTQGKFETIEIIEEITKGYSDGYVAYCVGNALKYLARAPFKHGEPSEDLSKAAKYLAFANEYLDAKSTQD